MHTHLWTTERAHLCPQSHSWGQAGPRAPPPPEHVQLLRVPLQVTVRRALDPKPQPGMVEGHWEGEGAVLGCSSRWNPPHGGMPRGERPCLAWATGSMARWEESSFRVHDSQKGWPGLSRQQNRLNPVGPAFCRLQRSQAEVYFSEQDLEPQSSSRFPFVAPPSGRGF